MVEHRRSQRKRASQTITVTNSLNGEVIGTISNLSVDGLMLVGTRAFREDALYQVQFQLPGAEGASPRGIEVGLHEQWQEPSRFGGQYFVGFRIIDVGPDDLHAMQAWINLPGSQFD